MESSEMNSLSPKTIKKYKLAKNSLQEPYMTNTTNDKTTFLSSRLI